MHSEFEVYKLNDEGRTHAKEIAEIFDEALTQLYPFVSVDAGREWSIVRTKMEEASFFAKKAMSKNQQYQAKE